MQSLKSTFVAVLLLGLSVGLYQLSDTPLETIDTSLIPAVHISEGTQSLSSTLALQPEPAGTATTVAKDAPVQPPQLQQPTSKPAFAKVATNDRATGSFESSKTSAVANANVPKTDANNVQSFQYPDISKSERIEKPAELAATTASSNPNDEFAAANPTTSARDAGLINALENQFLGKSNDSQPDVEQPSDNESDSYQFASTTGTAQPIAAADSSMTQLAGSRTNDFESLDQGSHVVQAGSEPDLSTIPLSAAWPQVDKLVAESRFRDALKLLTRFYDSDDAQGPQRQRLLGWLDALAGKVIFSAEHHYRSQPYVVQANESLIDVASRWQVPAQLVYNVNRSEIPNPLSLAPGTELKVVDRPFDASIDLSSNVMTLFSDGLYAGRYPVSVGISGNVVAGEYRVLAKSEKGFRWRDATGNEYPPEAPENGYGPHWLGLSGSLCIHALKSDVEAGHRGCVGLSPTDAADIFQILSKASTITIVD